MNHIRSGTKEAKITKYACSTRLWSSQARQAAGRQATRCQHTPHCEQEQQTRRIKQQNNHLSWSEERGERAENAVIEDFSSGTPIGKWPKSHRLVAINVNICIELIEVDFYWWGNTVVYIYKQQLLSLSLLLTICFWFIRNTCKPAVYQIVLNALKTISQWRIIAYSKRDIRYWCHIKVIYETNKLKVVKPWRGSAWAQTYSYMCRCVCVCNWVFLAVNGNFRRK